MTKRNVDGPVVLTIGVLLFSVSFYFGTVRPILKPRPVDNNHLGEVKSEVKTTRKTDSKEYSPPPHISPEVDSEESLFAEDMTEKLASTPITPTPEPEKIILNFAEILPVQSLEMSFPGRQQVALIHVIPGKTVGAGEVLVEQFTADLEAQLAAKKAELEAAKNAASNDAKIRAAIDEVKHAYSESKRAYLLYQERAVSEADAEFEQHEWVQSVHAYKNAESEAETAKLMLPKIEAEIEAIEASLSQRKLKAPFAGEIGRVHTTVGAVVENQKVLEIFDLSSVKVNAAIEEEKVKEFTWWRNGKPVIEIEGRKIQGEITWISENIVAGMYQIIIQFPNERTRKGNWLIPAGASLPVYFIDESYQEVALKK